jgi:lipid-A-disaccharide synthase
MLVAGEPSGDLLGARLARALLARDPSLRMYGAGGPAMRAAGVETEVDIAELSVMGVTEIVGGLRRIFRSYRRLSSRLRASTPPELLVLVDFPDFNLRLARAARRAGVRVVHFVGPQVWAWRPGRIATIRARIDRMIVLFAFEQELYRRNGVDAHFVGHPLAEEVVASRPRAETRARYGLPADGPMVALLPGSRRRTVAQHLPVMLAAARRLGDAVSYVIACASGLDADALRAEVRSAGVGAVVAQEDTYNVVAASDVVAVTSGTATLECALLGRPMVVCYRMTTATYLLARALVRVPFIAMPNIVLGECVVPELIQAACTPQRIADELAGLLGSEERRARVAQRLSEIRPLVSRSGAADRAAALVLEILP